MRSEDMAIVKSLVSVAWADGEFADKEREMLDALIAAFEASDDEAKEIRAYAAEKKTLADMPLEDLGADDCRAVLQHAVLLTFVDREQHEAEKQFLAELVKKLGIGEAEAHEITVSAEARAKRFLNLL